MGEFAFPCRERMVELGLCANDAPKRWKVETWSIGPLFSAPGRPRGNLGTYNRRLVLGHVVRSRAEEIS